MKLYIYAKNDTCISSFDEVVESLKENVTEITTIVENRRSFREYDAILNEIEMVDIIAINDINDLGNNNDEIANRLKEYINDNKYLVVSNVPSTYVYGVNQPLNKAVLSTVLQTLMIADSKVLPMKKKPSVGRNKMDFPANWGELYDKWEKHEITSKSFLEMSGLKKATFYNMITEYRELKKINDDYINRYRKA